jgi:hypothetical protein
MGVSAAPICAEPSASATAPRTEKASETTASEVKRAAEETAIAAKHAAEAAEKAAQAADEARKTATSSTAIPSNRSTHIVGGYLSLWGDPFPTTTGINVAYNVYDFLRVNLGFGSDASDVFRLSTVGLGAKLFMPGWSLSPTVGMNLSFTKRDQDNRPRAFRGLFAQWDDTLREPRVRLGDGAGTQFCSGIRSAAPSRIFGDVLSERRSLFVGNSSEKWRSHGRDETGIRERGSTYASGDERAE